MADEIQNLILQVKGQQELERLNAALDKEQEKLRELIQLQAQSAAGQGRSQPVIDATAAKILDLNKRIEELAGSGGGRGRGLLGASYAFQDFMSVLTNGGGVERALMGVSNNIDQLATAAGASAATAAKLSIAFTGFVSVLPALIPLFKELWQAVSGGEAAQEAQQKLEALKKEFDSLINAPTRSEKSGLDALRSAVTEGPSEGVFKGIAEAVGASPRLRSEFTESERKEMADLRDQMRLNPGVRFRAGEERIRAIEEARNERDRATARNLMTGMLHADEAGVNSLRTVRGIVDANPSAFPAGFLGDVERALPENRKQQEEFERQGALNAANMANQARIRDEERKRLEQQKQWEIQGRKNAQAYDRQQEQKAEREEAQAAQQEQADADRSDAAWIRGKPARQKRQKFNEARGLAAQAAASQGFTRENGNAPTAEQLDQMATATLHNMSNGMSGNDAAMMALGQKLQQIMATAQQMQQMQMNMQRMMMGGDWGSPPSMMPAGPF